MNTQNTAWLSYINEISAEKKGGEFLTKDSTGSPIVLEWEKINPKTSRLSEKINLLCPLLIQAYLKIEIDFAQKHPEAIANEMFLKSLEPFFKEGLDNVDWNSAEEQLADVLKQFFTKTDWATYSKEKDVHFLIVARNKKTEEQLGTIQFIITQEYDYGTVKIGLYDGVMPKIKNHDIEKILLSSVFKLIPDTKRIFLHTRMTNSYGINSHQALGFSQFSGDLPNWIDLEYLADNSDILQNFSNNFVEASNQL